MAYLLPILLIAKAQRDRRNEEARRRRAETEVLVKDLSKDETKKIDEEQK